MGQGVLDGRQHHLVDSLPVPEPQLHLCGVHIDIQKFRFDLKMEQGKGVFVLHHKRFVGLLDGLGDNAAFDVSSINIVVFVIPVAPGDHRLSDIAGQLHRPGVRGHRQQIGGDLPAEYGVDNVL